MQRYLEYQATTTLLDYESSTLCEAILDRIGKNCDFIHSACQNLFTLCFPVSNQALISLVHVKAQENKLSKKFFVLNYK